MTKKEKEIKKKGRPKAIESPEAMYELFQAYREKTKSNPIRVQDYVGKDAEMVYRERERPLTMVGFNNYCFEQGIISDLSDYFENKNDSYSEFLHITRVIKEIIKQDQIEGGMANIYNPAITQRLNGLTDKIDVNAEVKSNVTTNQTIDLSTIPSNVLEELLKHSQKND